MPAHKQLIGFTPAQAATYVGYQREVIVELGTFALRVMDGVTPGGFRIQPLLGTIAMTQGKTLTVSDNSVINQDVSSNGAPTFKGLTLQGDVLFTDATYDIGKSGATRPRDGFYSRNVAIGGTLSMGSITGLVGIGMTPVNVLDITQNQNSVSIVSILNNNAGNSAAARFAATNGTHSISASVWGENYASVGVIIAKYGAVLTDLGLSLGALGGPLLFASNGTTEQGRFDTGQFKLTADLLFIDATYDIGKTGATRPRDGFFSRNLTVGGTLTLATAIGPASGGKPSNRFSHTLTSYTPVGVAGAARLMQGLAAGASPWLLTPTITGNVRIRLNGHMLNTTAGASAVIQFLYGTGAAPANGAALTGTSFNATDISVYSTNAGTPVPISFEAEVTGLTLSTQYWFDGGLLPTGGVGTATLVVRSVIIEEF